MQVGDTIVLMIRSGDRDAPVNFNSRNSYNHPARGKVLKVGSKFVHVQGNEKTPWTVLPYSDGAGDGRYAVPLDVAKRLYRESLVRHRAWHTDAFIDECVRKL